MITGPRPRHSVRGGGQWAVDWTPECARESFSGATFFVGLNTNGQRLQYPPASPPLPGLIGLKVTVKLSNNACGGWGGGGWITGKLVCFCPGK